MKAMRLLGISLVLSLVVAALASASGQQSGSGSGSSGVTTIRVWTNDAHSKPEVDELVAKFNSGVGAQKGIKVEYTVYAADWQQALDMALNTGKEPELFKGISTIPQHYMQGRLLSWEEIPGIENVLKAQAPYHVNESTIFSGKPYSVVLFGWASGFHYNKSLLQRAGYSQPPKTWAEFEDAAIKISRLEPGKIYGYALPLAWSPSFREWIIEYASASSVGHMFYNHTTGKYQFTDYAPYFESLRRIITSDALFPGMESLTDDQMRAQFAEGNIGFILGGGWNVGVLYEQFPFKGDLNGWDYAPLPVQNPNQSYAVPMSASASLYASAQIKKDPNKLAKIGDVINLFCGDEMQSVLFTKGKNLPVRDDIIAKAAPAVRAQWSSYGKSFGTTVALPQMPHDFIAVEGLDHTAIISQILTGQVQDIRAALADLDKRYNAAFDQAVQRNVIKRENYIDSTMDSKFRRK